MREKEEKRISLRKKLWIGGLAFFFLVLLITSFFGQKGLLEIHRAQKKQKELLQEIEELKKEKKNLEREIDELEKYPEAVDKEAREKLWLMKPDEVVVVKKKK